MLKMPVFPENYPIFKLSCGIWISYACNTLSFRCFQFLIHTWTTISDLQMNYKKLAVGAQISLVVLIKYNAIIERKCAMKCSKCFENDSKYSRMIVRDVLHYYMIIDNVEVKCSKSLKMFENDLKWYTRFDKVHFSMIYRSLMCVNYLE